MALRLRSRVAQRLSTVKEYLSVKLPIIEETPLTADVLYSHQFAFPEVRGIIPIIVRGKAYGEVAGRWYAVSFPRTLVDPSVVCVGEARAGAIPDVKAPAIKISTVAVPKPIPIEIPVTLIPYINESFPYYTSDYAWVREQLCAPLNRLTKSLYRVQSRINDAIGRINDGFGKTKNAFQSTNSSLSDFRNKVQGALDGDRKNTENAVNSGLSRDRKNTEDAVNSGLSRVIPGLYAAWGISERMIVTPLHVRSVSPAGFQFQSFGKTTAYYIAMGSLL